LFELLPRHKNIIYTLNYVMHIICIVVTTNIDLKIIKTSLRVTPHRYTSRILSLNLNSLHSFYSKWQPTRACTFKTIIIFYFYFYSTAEAENNIGNMWNICIFSNDGPGKPKFFIRHYVDLPVLDQTVIFTE